MVCRLNRDYADFHIDLIERAKLDIEQAVCEETITLGFIYRTLINGKFIDEIDEQLSFYPLEKGELVIQAAPELHLSSSKSIFLQKVAGYKFCLYDIHTERRVEELFKKVTGESIDCLNTNSFSVYKASLESGAYITLSVKPPGEEQCINYLPALKMYTVRDDIVIYFGVLRKKNRPISDNAAFVWEELLKEYGGIISI